MKKLWVSAGIKLLPGKSSVKAAHALLELMKKTQLEPGCIQFEIYQHLENPDCFTLWECWNDKAALQEHLALEHTQEYFRHDYTELRYLEKMKSL